MQLNFDFSASRASRVLNIVYLKGVIEMGGYKNVIDVCDSEGRMELAKYVDIFQCVIRAFHMSIEKSGNNVRDRFSA